RFVFFRRKAAYVPLSRTERAAIHDAELAAALANLTSTVEHSIAARRERAKRFESALAQWRTWCSGHSWLESVRQLEPGALRQRQALEDESTSWDQSWSEAARHLHHWLEHVASMLRAYDQLLASRSAPEEVAVRLSRAQRESLGLQAAKEAVE